MHTQYVNMQCNNSMQKHTRPYLKNGKKKKNTATWNISEYNNPGFIEKPKLSLMMCNHAYDSIINASSTVRDKPAINHISESILFLSKWF